MGQIVTLERQLFSCSLEKVLQCGRRNFWVSKKSYQDEEEKTCYQPLVCCHLGSGDNQCLKREYCLLVILADSVKIGGTGLSDLALQGPPRSSWSCPLPSGRGRPHPSTCPSTYRYLLRGSGSSREVTFRFKTQMENAVAFVTLQSKHSLQAKKTNEKLQQFMISLIIRETIN